MNYCYYCEKPVDRAPYDRKQHICDWCRKTVAKKLGKMHLSNTGVHDYWSLKPAEQANVRQVVEGKNKP